MDTLIAAVELVVSVCLSVAILFLVWLFVRRHLLQAAGDLVISAVALPGRTSWTSGFLRMDHDQLVWFPLVGWSVRPVHVWRRMGIEIGSLTPLAEGASFDPSAGATQVQAQPGDLAPAVTQVVLGQEPYTALRAWVEATPFGNRPLQG